MMKFGILGCRHPHIEIFIQEMLDLGHELVAICDTNPDIAQSMAAKYSVTLLKDEKDFFALKPQVVGTSAINNEKIQVIETCREHGIHVMVDKPVVTNMADYERLKEIIYEGVIHVGLMLTERFNPPIYTLWSMIQKGVLGDLINLTIIKPHKLNEKSRAPWHFSKVQNGGIAIDLLIHDFDLLRWFTKSEMEDCSGFMKKSSLPYHPDFYDSVHTIIKMKNGVVATLEADWWTPDSYWTWGDGRIFCTGTLGRAEIREAGDINNKNSYGLLVTNDKEYHVYDNIETNVTLSEDFLNRIEGKEDVIITANDILNATYDTLVADSKLVLTPLIK
jgi:predicted dehydrogenase